MLCSAPVVLKNTGFHPASAAAHVAHVIHSAAPALPRARTTGTTMHLQGTGDCPDTCYAPSHLYVLDVVSRSERQPSAVACTLQLHKRVS